MHCSITAVAVAEYGTAVDNNVLAPDESYSSRMSNSGQTNSAMRTTNLISIVVIVVFLALGGVLLLVSSNTYPSELVWLQALLAQSGGLLVATGVITISWELLGKRAFLDEILTKTRLRADIVNAGLERVTDKYLQDVEWDDLFLGSRQLDIVVAYATTWRNTHRARLEHLASKSGNKLRVFLPDPDDAATMKVLGDRFKMAPDDLSVRVREAIKDFQSMGPPNRVEVYTRPGDALFSCYMFDRRTVITLYSHSQERRGSVPTFLAGGGMMSDFVATDIVAIRKQSALAPR